MGIRTFIWAAIGIVCIALIFRCHRLDSSHIWYDETVSINVAHGLSYEDYSRSPSSELVFQTKDYSQKNTLANVIKATISDHGNSLFYNVLLHYYLKLMPYSDGWAKSFSILMGVLAVILVLFLAFELTRDYRVALLSGFLLAIDPVSVGLSYEIRCYSLGIVLSIGSTILMLRAVRLQRFTDYVFFSLISALLFFTHYLAIYIILAQGIYLLTQTSFKDHSKKILFSVGLFLSLVFLWFLLLGVFQWLSIMGQMNARVKTSQVHNSGILAFLVGVMRQALDFFRLNPFRFSAPYSMVIAIFNLCLIGFLGVSFLKEAGLKNKKLLFLGLLISSSIFFFASLVLLSGNTVFLQYRYFSFSYPFAAIGSALVLMRLLRRNIIFKTILVYWMIWIFGLGWSAYAASSKSTYYHHLIAQKIERLYTPGDQVLYTNWYDALRVNLYLSKDNHYSQRVSEISGKDYRAVILRQDGQHIELGECRDKEAI